jgi:hypothetical protein
MTATCCRPASAMSPDETLHHRCGQRSRLFGHGNKESHPENDRLNAFGSRILTTTTMRSMRGRHLDGLRGTPLGPTTRKLLGALARDELNRSMNGRKLNVFDERSSCNGRGTSFKGYGSSKNNLSGKKRGGERASTTRIPTLLLGLPRKIVLVLADIPPIRQ